MDELILTRIVEYVDCQTLIQPISLTCKTLWNIAERVASNRFEDLCQRHNVDEEEFATRVGSLLEARTAAPRRDGNARPPTPPWPARIKLKCATTVALKQRSGPLLGPTASLPNGNLVIVGSEPDNLIRVVNPHDMTVVGRPSHLGFAPIIDSPPVNLMMGPVSWLSDVLFYSNQHIVLLRKGMTSDTVWIHVWKQRDQEDEEEGSQFEFLYTKQGRREGENADSLEDLAVATQDATMYILWGRKEGGRVASYRIESCDIATGNTIRNKTIEMPRPADENVRFPRCTPAKLLVAKGHLLLLRTHEEQEPFPGIGLGAYSFSRNDLSQKSFLPCFQDGEVHVDHGKSSQTSQHVLFGEFGDGGHRSKKLSINSTTGDLVVGDFNVFGDRNNVELVTSTSVFMSNPDEAEIHLEEFDLATGQKLRTMPLGVGSADGVAMVGCILEHEPRGELFISISGGFRSIHTMLVYLHESM